MTAFHQTQVHTPWHVPHTPTPAPTPPPTLPPSPLPPGLTPLLHANRRAAGSDAATSVELDAAAEVEARGDMAAAGQRCVGW